MNSFFLHPLTHNRNEPDKLVLVTDHEPHTDEGSEFLDDAIRMVDEPFMNDIKEVAEGHRKDLL